MRHQISILDYLFLLHCLSVVILIFGCIFVIGCTLKDCSAVSVLCIIKLNIYIFTSKEVIPSLACLPGHSAFPQHFVLLLLIISYFQIHTVPRAISHVHFHALIISRCAQRGSKKVMEICIVLLFPFFNQLFEKQLLMFSFVSMLSSSISIQFKSNMLQNPQIEITLFALLFVAFCACFLKLYLAITDFQVCWEPSGLQPVFCEHLSKACVICRPSSY